MDGLWQSYCNWIEFIFEPRMSFQNENIGMMDEGYFVSRGDIIKWLNDLLHVPVPLLSSTSARSSSWGQGRFTARSST